MLHAAKMLFIAEMSLCIYQCIYFSFAYRLMSRILHHFVILWLVTERHLAFKLIYLKSGYFHTDFSCLFLVSTWNTYKNRHFRTFYKNSPIDGNIQWFWSCKKRTFCST